MHAGIFVLACPHWTLIRDPICENFKSDVAWLITLRGIKVGDYTFTDEGILIVTHALFVLAPKLSITSSLPPGQEGLFTFQPCPFLYMVANT